MAANFYSTGGSNPFYTSLMSGASEIDLRAEITAMFDGRYPEIPKAQRGLLRSMRLDTSGQKIPCGCVDSTTGEQDKDRFCPVCMSEGFLWNESYIDFFPAIEGRAVSNILKDQLLPTGLINIPFIVFYIRYNTTILQHDKIVMLKLDSEGEPVSPVSRQDVYRIETLWGYRSDRGRIEYWKAFTHREDVKYVNPPTYSELV